MKRHDELSVKVDKREKATNDIVRLFQSHADVAHAEAEQLPVGDILVDDQVVFERKRPKDFVDSIRDRRLDDQISRMYDEFGPENSYLTVAGNVESFRKMIYTNMSKEAVFGFIGSIAARWQMIPLFVGDIGREMELITRIARKHEEKSDRVVRSPESTPSRKSDDYYTKMILQLNGIGRKTAADIRERFSTPIELIVAKPEELEEVDGIGEKTADSIIDQLTVDETN